jgi:hypothetical protein
MKNILSIKSNYRKIIKFITAIFMFSLTHTSRSQATSKCAII